jgi:hypothetical protein
MGLECSTRACAAFYLRAPGEMREENKSRGEAACIEFTEISQFLCIFLI